MRHLSSIGADKIIFLQNNSDRQMDEHRDGLTEVFGSIEQLRYTKCIENLPTLSEIQTEVKWNPEIHSQNIKYSF